MEAERAAFIRQGLQNKAKSRPNTANPRPKAPEPPEQSEYLGSPDNMRGGGVPKMRPQTSGSTRDPKKKRGDGRDPTLPVGTIGSSTSRKTPKSAKVRSEVEKLWEAQLTGRNEERAPPQRAPSKPPQRAPSKPPQRAPNKMGVKKSVLEELKAAELEVEALEAEEGAMKREILDLQERKAREASEASEERRVWADLECDEMDDMPTRREREMLLEEELKAKIEKDKEDTRRKKELLENEREEEARRERAAREELMRSEELRERS